MKWHGFEGFVFAGDVGVKIRPYTMPCLCFLRMFCGKALTQITSDMLHLMLLKVFTFVGEGAVIA